MNMDMQRSHVHAVRTHILMERPIGRIHISMHIKSAETMTEPRMTEPRKTEPQKTERRKSEPRMTELRMTEPRIGPNLE